MKSFLLFTKPNKYTATQSLNLGKELTLIIAELFAYSAHWKDLQSHGYGTYTFLASSYGLYKFISRLGVHSQHKVTSKFALKKKRKKSATKFQIITVERIIVMNLLYPLESKHLIAQYVWSPTILTFSILITGSNVTVGFNF